MYKAVFCDIDGTLLTSSLTITPATRKCIFGLQNSGVHFIAASGRSPSGIYPLFKKYGIRCPMITCSGALVLDGDGSVIFEKGLPADTVSALVDYVEKEKLPVTWGIYSKNEWYVKDRHDPRVVKIEAINNSRPKGGTYESIKAGQLVHKIVLICDPGNVEQIESRINAAFPDVCAVRSTDILIEVVDRSVNKAESVKKLCHYIGIHPKDAAAIGDHYNDAEMLETVGLGILMDNAPDDLKNRFPTVTKDNDHDGVAYAIENLI